jgi:hypothetical protein
MVERSTASNLTEEKEQSTLTEEATYTATLKAGKEFDAPWLVVRADDEQEIESRLLALESGGTLATLGRVAATFGAAYNLGKGLGARGLDAPVNAVVEQPTFVQQPVAQPAVAAYLMSPNTPTHAAQPVAEAPRPGVPLIMGMEAKLVKGNSARGPWQAWADPRPAAMTAAATEKTDNPSHPGLQNGTHKFWAFIR